MIIIDIALYTILFSLINSYRSRLSFEKYKVQALQDFELENEPSKNKYPFLQLKGISQIFFLKIVFALGGSPTPHPISSRPNFCMYMGPVHLSPVTWPQALRYWYSLTLLMHIVAQLHPIDLHNFLGQIPESSQFLGAIKLPLLE
jgi:hypothetical protein